jgi:hypothetical protein
MEPEIEAVDRENRQVLLTDGTIVTTLTWFDEEGESGCDPAEATVVAVEHGNFYIIADLAQFEDAVTLH